MSLFHNQIIPMDISDTILFTSNSYNLEDTNLSKDTSELTELDYLNPVDPIIMDPDDFLEGVAGDQLDTVNDSPDSSEDDLLNPQEGESPDTPLPLILIKSSDNKASETGNDPGEFTIRRRGDTSDTLTVGYSISGSANPGEDYDELLGRVTLAPGEPTTQIPINLIDDSLFEGSENVILTLEESSQYQIDNNNSSANVFIKDDELPPPQLQLTPTDKNASETGNNPGKFTIVRRRNTNNTLTVPYSIGGTANPGDDYNNLRGTVTFAPGESRAEVAINVIDDQIFERVETVILTLEENSEYSIVKSKSASVFIQDNELPPPRLQLTASDKNASETGNNPGEFTIRRLGDTSNLLSVGYSMSGSASPGEDYDELTGTVRFAPGQSKAQIPINVIDDTLFEGGENVILTLEESSNYLIGKQNSSASILIQDNDPPLPQLKVEATDNQASETGNNPGEFTIGRLGDTSNLLSVGYSMSGSASPGEDYDELTGTVTLAPGQSQAQIPINVIDDNQFEGDETVILTLKENSQYQLVDNYDSDEITIEDNDTNLSSPEIYTYEIIETYPHDKTAFTQGLIYTEDSLYEGTGLRGSSSLRKVDLETGEVEQIYELEDQYFGEGITRWEDEIIQLTWRSKKAFVYDLETFAVIKEFEYETEGWGLTHDGTNLIMSDGTDEIAFRDPDTFEIVKTIEVRDGNRAINKINELEYIDGEIWANIWFTDDIAIISPETGQVTGWVELDGLRPSSTLNNSNAVLNGIAYDSEDERIFVTGKLWPELYEIEIFSTDS